MHGDAHENEYMRDHCPRMGLEITVSLVSAGFLSQSRQKR